MHFYDSTQDNYDNEKGIAKAASYNLYFSGNLHFQNILR